MPAILSSQEDTYISSVKVAINNCVNIPHKFVRSTKELFGYKKSKEQRLLSDLACYVFQVAIVTRPFKMEFSLPKPAFSCAVSIFGSDNSFHHSVQKFWESFTNGAGDLCNSPCIYDSISYGKCSFICPSWSDSSIQC